MNVIVFVNQADTPVYSRIGNRSAFQVPFAPAAKWLRTVRSEAGHENGRTEIYAHGDGIWGAGRTPANAVLAWARKQPDRTG